MPRSFKKSAIFFFAFCISTAFAQANVSESVVKAAMLRKFVEFIEWPEANAPKKLLRANVCVYGDTDVIDAAIVFNKASEKSPLQYGMARIDSLNFPDGKCQIVFLGSSPDMADILQRLKTRSVLTVSDSSGFVEKGGMLGFVVADGKLRYAINNKAFGESGLKVDAQLLEIAHKVVN